MFSCHMSLWPGVLMPLCSAHSEGLGSSLVLCLLLYVLLGLFTIMESESNPPEFALPPELY